MSTLFGNRSSWAVSTTSRTSTHSSPRLQRRSALSRPLRGRSTKLPIFNLEMTIHGRYILHQLPQQRGPILTEARTVAIVLTTRSAVHWKEYQRIGCPWTVPGHPLTARGFRWTASGQVSKLAMISLQQQCLLEWRVPTVGTA